MMLGFYRLGYPPAVKAWHLLAVTACLAGCADPGRDAERYFGSEAWAIMEKADRLEGFRVVPIEAGIKFDPKGKVRGGVRIVGAPMDPGEDWLKLFSLVEDPHSYDWTKKPTKEPVPEVLFRFITADKKQADLLICFSQSMLSLAVTGSENRWVSFEPARQRYIELVQHVFVLDQFIRSLSEGNGSQPSSRGRAL